MRTLNHFRSVFFLFGLLNFGPLCPDGTGLIMHFKLTPKDQAEHKRWNLVAEGALEALSEAAFRAGYIVKPATPQRKRAAQAQKADESAMEPSYIGKVVQKGVRLARHVFKSLTGGEDTEESNMDGSGEKIEKTRSPFFTRKDYDFGFFALYVPGNIPYAFAVETLEKYFAKQGVEMYLDKDEAVRLDFPIFPARKIIGFENDHLSLNQLTKLQNFELAKEKEGESLPPGVAQVAKYLFWYQEIPTVGMRKSKRFPVYYPYLPHFFGLWDLAPKKGAGVKVAMIDTGISAFRFEGMPEYKKNQDLLMVGSFQTDSYNLSSHGGEDRIMQITDAALKYAKEGARSRDEVAKMVLEWIWRYTKFDDEKPAKDFLEKFGKPGLIGPDGQLRVEGKKAMEEIFFGDKGIAPAGKKAFTIAKMVSPSKQEVILEFVPAVKVLETAEAYVAGHGSSTSGIVGGRITDVRTDHFPNLDTGICGIAPRCDLVMIKAFDDNGGTSKSILVAAIKKAIALEADVVNMSLKVMDKLDPTSKYDKLLKRMVGLVPYIVAASGNGGSPKFPNYAGEVEAYPAHFNSVSFDVGAFSWDSAGFPVSVFSQWQKGIGPKFVAPGLNILSSGLIPQQEVQSEYVFSGGTSLAVPIVSGFLALVLGEFGDTFSRTEIENTCYKSAIKMHKDKGWDKKVVLGTPDMRTVLFLLETISQIRKRLYSAHPKLEANFTFDKLLEIVWTIINSPLQTYAQEHLGGVDMHDDFYAFFQATLTNKDSFDSDPTFKTFGQQPPEVAIHKIASLVEALIVDRPRDIPPFFAKDDNLIASVKALLKEKEIDIFSTLNEVQKQVIKRTEEADRYWVDVAARVGKKS